MERSWHEVAEAVGRAEDPPMPWVPGGGTGVW